MKKKQIIAILLIFAFASVASFTFVSAMPNKVSSKLEDELSRLDAGSIDILIETFSQDYTSIISEIESYGGIVTDEFKYASGLAAKIPITAIKDLKALSNVKKISKDEVRHISSSTPTFINKELDDYIFGETALSMDGREIRSLSTSQVENIMDTVPETYWNFLSMNAGPVWEYNMGQDSLVVIIDTGVYDEHVMIQHAVIDGIDLSPDAGTPDWNSPDNHWHGTHCTGIIAGSAYMSFSNTNDLLYQSYIYHTGIAWTEDMLVVDGDPNTPVLPLFGMAPMADIYGIKVFPSSGEGVPESYIINAIEHAIDMHESGDYDVDVISMSLGGGTGFDGRDLEDQTVDYATSIGITVVTSAGNDGPASRTVGSPGTANTAITVGAVADPVNTRIFWDLAVFGFVGGGDYLFTSETPQVIYFSSRGPTSDGRLKPELCATGVYVISSVTPGPGDLAWASGTSMACPAVAGAVALLNSWGESEGASPYDYKQALVDGAVWLDGYDAHDQGAGNLNAFNSFTSLMDQGAEGSLGEEHPDLRKGYSRTPVKPEGINTHINGKGTFSYTVENLEPGHGFTFYLKASERTSFLKIEISDVELNIDPIYYNSFELSVQSAVRSSLDYYIDSANVWGDATFEISDYSTTWSGYTYDVYYQETPIQPGYIQITLENDWTSYDVLSGTIEITVEQDRPFWSNGKKAPKPDETYKGVIDTFESIYIFPVVPGTSSGAIFELRWKNDWTRYPTSDLDMLIFWSPDGNFPFYFVDYGASLRSPEGVYIEGLTGYFLVWIDGYETYGVSEPWTLNVYYL